MHYSGLMTSSDYRSVIDAAGELGMTKQTVYVYLRRPEKDTGIKRMKVGKTTYVHMPTLKDYEATRKTGRPPKS